jgi:flagellar M-ring protein FliF
MSQWRKLLASFTAGQRVMIVAVAAAVALGLFGLARWRRESNFRILYTGLAPDDAGAVVARLREEGTDYRLSEDGRTVLAPSEKVAELRLAMAAAGLPKSGRIGFELFDRNNFGATEFTEQVNFRRALEGELERSVMSLAEVEQARVHLTFPKDSVFLESRQPAKASVMVRLRPGARISNESVQAVSHLVASAVEGLAPESVSVLDTRGNLLHRARARGLGNTEEASDATLAYRQSVERDLAAKIRLTLEPLLGAERFRTGVSVECDFTSGEQSEETFDPSKSVMLSSLKTEEISGTGGANGVPGTASNLPRPASRPGSSQAGVSRRTENVAYQSSRVVKRIKLPQGAVKRMSIAVLIDHDAAWQGEGAARKRVLTAPSPERLKSIRDVVAAVTGFSQERGDQLIVEALPFDSTIHDMEPPPGASPAPAPVSSLPGWLPAPLRDPKLLAAAGAGVVLLLVLAAGALWMMRRRRGSRVRMRMPPELPPGGAEAAEIARPSAAPGAAEKRTIAEAKIPELAMPATKKSDVLLAQLREHIRKDAGPPAQVLETWLTEEQEQ